MKYVEIVYNERFKDARTVDCYYVNRELVIILGNAKIVITKNTSEEEIIAIIKDIITW